MNLLKEKGWSLAYLTKAYLSYYFLKVNANMQLSPKFDILVSFSNLFESIKKKKTNLQIFWMMRLLVDGHGQSGGWLLVRDLGFEVGIDLKKFMEAH